jgi:hypothetical protein
MIIVTSAAYAETGLITEFGKLPPAMLPLQNRRLYQHQFEKFSVDELKILSLPQDYCLTGFDKEYISNENIKIVFVPNGLSLGQSLIYVLNVIGKYNEPLKILHGDTLFLDIPIDLDICLVSKVEDNYCWQYSEDFGSDYIYAGYFSFSDQSLLIQKITENNFKFIEGISSYKLSRGLKEIVSSCWLDFSLENTYFRSRSYLTTQRKFNDIVINRYSVKKYSTQKDKILAEANWFQSVPANMKPYMPALWQFGESNDKAFYEIEYFYLSTISDLFVFSKHPFFVWKSIINSCIAFIDTCLMTQPKIVDDYIEQSKLLFKNKTINRLKEFATQTNISLNTPFVVNGVTIPSISEIVLEMSSEIPDPISNQICVIHGDFCFSNILYNFKTLSIKVIDPRGLNALNEQTIFGDVRYDIAKLSHSLLGLYDFIISGQYCYKENGPYNIEFIINVESEIIELQEYFRCQKFANKTIFQLSIYPILVHLFLSMLPLHSDNPRRQKALLANAFKLYIEYKDYKSLNLV